MGQLSRRNNKIPVATVQSGQQLWLESCVACKRPMTIVALERPAEPRCASCTEPS